MAAFWENLLAHPLQSLLAVRPLPPEPALPALGEPAFVPLPGQAEQPFLWEREEAHWLFCRAAQGGAIAACALPTAAAPQPVLEDAQGLAWPSLFESDGQLYLAALCGRAPAVYRCVEFPAKWQAVQRFPAEGPLEALLAAGPAMGRGGVQFLACAADPKAPRRLRWRRYTLAPAAEGEGPFTLAGDETFNLQNREYGDTLCGGAPFAMGGWRVRPACVSGRRPYLQFYADRAPSTGSGPNPREMALCAALPGTLAVRGIDPIGVCGYARDNRWEVLALQALAR